jgi:FlaG/FlaF family flagellin (archaellin)
MRPAPEHAVSPVIGVMLMIVVTIIIAAVVSAFAGNFSGSDRKAPSAAFSAEVLPWVEVPAGNSTGILFTHNGGDYIDLNYVTVVLSCGAESIRFGQTGSDTTPYGDDDGDGKGYPHIFKVGPRDVAYHWDPDFQLNTGNQFMLYADNNGNGHGVLGWQTPSVFYLTENEICTWTLVDRTSQQTISGGVIDL